MPIFTAERTNEKSESDNPIYQRHLFAYEQAIPLIQGDVLEVGCGEGYGSRLLAPNTKKYTAIDKFVALNKENLLGVEFIQMNVPHLTPFADNTFDIVVSFQVIEHIDDDHLFLKEIHRVLKPGGKLIMTTPNIKMSLTRNPYHVREYTHTELTNLTATYFSKVESNGVFLDKIANEYFEKNRESVQKITRWDILNLQYRLPRWALQVPYDLANRFNRLKLNNANSNLVSTITTKNFTLDTANERCIDLFIIATK